MKNTKDISLNFNFDLERYDIAHMQLFMAEEQCFPSSLKETDYYNVKTLLPDLVKKFNIDLETATSKFVIDYTGYTHMVDAMLFLQDGLYLVYYNGDDIRTNKSKQDRNDDDDDDNDDYPFGRRNAKVKESEDDHFELNLEFLYNPKKITLSKVREIVDSLKKHKVELLAQAKLNIVVKGDGGLSLKSFKIQQPKINIPINYGEAFEPVYEHILAGLSKKKNIQKGLVLLHGAPGTGKTSLLRFLINKLAENKKVIYMPPDLAAEISNPSFIPFLMNHPNSILVIEDAENILRDRKSSNNQSIANLLNLADGLLSDCLQMQVICTFNAELTDIDPALRREGRLIAEYHFGPLPKEQAQKVADLLGIKDEIKGDMTLAQIYNLKSKTTLKKETTKKKIGF